MARLVAAGAAVIGALMIFLTDMKTDWTPQFLIVLGVVGAVCLGALTLSYLETRTVGRSIERTGAAIDTATEAIDRIERGGSGE